MSKMDPIERARAFSYGTLSNEVEFVLSVIKKNQILTDKEKSCLTAGVDFFDRIVWLEEHENECIEAQKKSDLLSDSKELVETWIKSGVDFPKNDQEFLQRLENYSKFLRELTKTIKVTDQALLNDLIEIFSTMDEINLHKVHTPFQSCHLF